VVERVADDSLTGEFGVPLKQTAVSPQRQLSPFEQHAHVVGVEWLRSRLDGERHRLEPSRAAPPVQPRMNDHRAQLILRSISSRVAASGGESEIVTAPDSASERLGTAVRATDSDSAVRTT